MDRRTKDGRRDGHGQTYIPPPKAGDNNTTTGQPASSSVVFLVFCLCMYSEKHVK